MGLKLWGLEYLAGAGRAIVRIYIEAQDRPVDVEDCARLSRNLDVALDVEDIMPGAYTLEVSSPGFDRRFFSPEQLADYMDSQVLVNLHNSVPGQQGRKKFHGKIISIDGCNITLDMGESKLTVGWADIKQIRLAT